MDILCYLGKCAIGGALSSLRAVGIFLGRIQSCLLAFNILCGLLNNNALIRNILRCSNSTLISITLSSLRIPINLDRGIQLQLLLRGILLGRIQSRLLAFDILCYLGKCAIRGALSSLRAVGIFLGRIQSCLLDFNILCGLLNNSALIRNILRRRNSTLISITLSSLRIPISALRRRQPIPVRLIDFHRVHPRCFSLRLHILGRFFSHLGGVIDRLLGVLHSLLKLLHSSGALLGLLVCIRGTLVRAVLSSLRSISILLRRIQRRLAAFDILYGPVDNSLLVRNNPIRAVLSNLCSVSILLRRIQSCLLAFNILCGLLNNNALIRNILRCSNSTLISITLSSLRIPINLDRGIQLQLLLHSILYSLFNSGLLGRNNQRGLPRIFLRRLSCLLRTLLS
ncbi:Uncharacterised protein [Mycobacteroides abscessus subsp. bolletii]|nr:Uncharacterised protein [Mycobacteroides abscessus subsp. bolletii]